MFARIINQTCSFLHLICHLQLWNGAFFYLNRNCCHDFWTAAVPCNKFYLHPPQNYWLVINWNLQPYFCYLWTWKFISLLLLLQVWGCYLSLHICFSIVTCNYMVKRNKNRLYMMRIELFIHLAPWHWNILHWTELWILYLLKPE